MNGGLATKLLIFALAVIVTMAAAWFTLGSDTVSRGELNELNDTVKELSLRVQDLTTQLAVLNNEIKHLRNDRDTGAP